MLEAREAVKNLQAYRPPLAGRQGLRLDFNESTAGCSPRVLERLRLLDAETLARYPEREPVAASASTGSRSGYLASVSASSKRKRSSTRGEHPAVLSLKSRRSPCLPARGGRYACKFFTASRASSMGAPHTQRFGMTVQA